MMSLSLNILSPCIKSFYQAIAPYIPKSQSSQKNAKLKASSYLRHAYESPH